MKKENKSKLTIIYLPNEIKQEIKKLKRFSNEPYYMIIKRLIDKEKEEAKK